MDRISSETETLLNGLRDTIAGAAETYNTAVETYNNTVLLLNDASDDVTRSAKPLQAAIDAYNHAIEELADEVQAYIDSRSNDDNDNDWGSTPEGSAVDDWQDAIARSECADLDDREIWADELDLYDMEEVDLPPEAPEPAETAAA